MNGPGDPKLKALLQRVNAGLKNGGDTTSANAYIKRETGGTYTSAIDLAAAVNGGPKERGALGTAGDMLRMGLQGGSFGWSDEGRGVIGAIGAMLPGGLSPGEAYTQQRDAERQNLAATREAHPVASVVAEGLGGLALPGIGMAKAGSQALGLGAQAVRGLKLGSIAGAITGTGMSEESSPWEVAKDAALGGTLGGVTGMALPGLVAGAKSLGTKVSNLHQMITSPDAAAKRTGMTRLIKMFENLGMTPQEALEETQKMAKVGGADIIAADLNPNLASEARRALTNAPGQSTRILDQMEGRAAGRGGRLASEAEGAMGITREGVDEAKGAAISAIRKLGDRLYGPLRGKPIPAEAESRIEEFLRDPVLDRLDPNVAKAMRSLYQDPPKPPPQIRPGMKRADLEKLGYTFDGGVPKPPSPAPAHSFDKLKEIRHALLGLKNQAVKAGNDDTAQKYAEKASELTDLMEDIFPGYHNANAQIRRARVGVPQTADGQQWDFNTAGGGTKASVKVRDAWLEGADALGKTAPEVQQTMSALLEVGGPEAADAFRAGWLESVVTELRSASKNGNLGESLLAMGDDIADVHRLMFPRPEDYNRMMRRAGVERSMRRTESAIAGARSTIPQGEIRRELTQDIEMGAMGGIGGKWSMVRNLRVLGQQLGGKVERKSNEHMLKFLTSPPSPENQALWAELQGMLQQRAQPNPMQQGLSAALPLVGGQVAGGLAAGPPGQNIQPF